MLKYRVFAILSMKIQDEMKPKKFGQVSTRNKLKGSLPRDRKFEFYEAYIPNLRTIANWPDR